MEYDLAFWAGPVVQLRDLFGVEPELDSILGSLLSLCHGTWVLRAPMSSFPDEVIGLFCGSDKDNGHENIVPLNCKM